MKAIFDFTISFFISILLLIPALIIFILVKLSSPGPGLYWSNRIGAGNVTFRMPKFRTMYLSAPEVATDKLRDPLKWITPLGAFLRRSSLDEIPQLWCVMSGKMSLVGPRPALFNQYDLILERTKLGVHILKPGITGLAQVSGRDNLSVSEKVLLDLKYLENHSLLFDAKIIGQTVIQVFSRANISH